MWLVAPVLHNAPKDVLRPILMGALPPSINSVQCHPGSSVSSQLEEKKNMEKYEQGNFKGQACKQQ